MTGSWMAAALSRDLPTGVVIPVRVPDGPLALWRSASGGLAACADRCPHRGMRLSHGFVRGEALSCIYHGWSYAPSGACVRIPAHPGLKPPEAIRVQTWRVAEAHGLVWIATGTPEGAPPDLDGFEPLRSLTARAGHTAIAAAAPGRIGAGDAGPDTSGTPSARLLLAPQAEGDTVMHVLVPDASPPAARVAASRWAEAVRRAAEAREGGEP